MGLSSSVWTKAFFGTAERVLQLNDVAVERIKAVDFALAQEKEGDRAD